MYLLIIIDEYFRVPFAYPCPNTENGISSISKEIQEFLNTHGVATYMSSPYNPRGNGQIERENETIWRKVLLALKQRNLLPSDWEVMLPDALHFIRSSLWAATNETPHERMIKHYRRSANGCSLPSWLEDGRKTTVSLRHLAPNGEGGTQLESRPISNEEQTQIKTNLKVFQKEKNLELEIQSLLLS
ncbi:hypothetical protein JTB14_022593 [Gonioctena quinquepunctata]|nr:hypothetical protein JTB14_022593 [Gonioctena quinquepunctata]